MELKFSKIFFLLSFSRKFVKICKILKVGETPLTLIFPFFFREGLTIIQWTE